MFQDFGWWPLLFSSSRESPFLYTGYFSWCYVQICIASIYWAFSMCFRRDAEFLKSERCCRSQLFWIMRIGFCLRKCSKLAVLIASQCIYMRIPCEHCFQEPGVAAEIKRNIAEKYGFEPDFYAKIAVNGAGADPLYKFLKNEQGNNEAITWNFAKFLVDKDGYVVIVSISSSSFFSDFQMRRGRCSL